jgi:hypothetical protein
MADGLDGLRSSPVLRWMGTLSIRTAMLALAAGALLGIVVTLVFSQEPGWGLGFFISIGTLAAALGVRRGAVYLFFPIPALAFFVSAVVTGFVKDSSLTSTSIGVRVGFLQWIADIFFPMVVATVIVLLVGGARWLLGRQLVMGRPLAAGPPGVPGTRAERDRPPRPGAPGSGPNGIRPGGPARPARPAGDARDARDARDPWGDPRPPMDRPRPGNGTRPRDSRDPRDVRDPQDVREPGDPRESRDQRSDRPAPEQQQPRDPRGSTKRSRVGDPWPTNDRERTQREPRDSRDPWDHR